MQHLWKMGKYEFFVQFSHTKWLKKKLLFKEIMQVTLFKSLHLIIFIFDWFYRIFEGQYLDDNSNDTYLVHTGVGHSAGGTTGGSGREEVTVGRKISNEFSPSSVTQQLDSWGTNFLELFSDSSRKGSTSNLQPLGK